MSIRYAPEPGGWLSGARKVQRLLRTMLKESESPDTAPSSASTILVIEDDPDAERTLRSALETSGHLVVSAASGADARTLLLTVKPDLIIMDLVLPDTDGLMLTLAFQTMTSAPIIICSGRKRQVDRVLGLRLGAADFVAKPVDLDELEARIEAILRRTAPRPSKAPPSTEIRVRDLVIAPSRASVRVANKPVHLTPTEYRLLVVLAAEPEKVFARESLTSRVWGYDDLNSNHIVDVHMGRLRTKLRSVSPEHEYVVTVRGRGYCVMPNARRTSTG